MDDREMIELFNRRTESALTEFLTHYGRLLRLLARNILPTEEDAEECVNDAALAVWESIPPSQPRSLSAYACSLVRNRAVDRLRYLTAEKRGGSAADIEKELETVISSDDVDDYLDVQELRRLLNDYLSSLNSKDRVLFLRRYYFCDDVKTIAREYTLSANAVSVRLSRIRAGLKQYLMERGIAV